MASYIYELPFGRGRYFLRQLPKVKLEAATHAERQGGRWLLVTQHDLEMADRFFARYGGEIVADTARAVLVDLGPGNLGQVHTNARVHHRIGEPGGLFGGHAPEQNRHQQRRRLVVWQGSSGHAGDEETNLFAVECPAVTFLDDDIERAQFISLKL